MLKGLLRNLTDFFDTFAPVTRISSVRILIALAAIHKLVIHQMDVKTTFLNDELEEEIYMTQPEGCRVQFGKNIGDASVRKKIRVF